MFSSFILISMSNGDKKTLHEFWYSITAMSRKEKRKGEKEHYVLLLI